MTEEKMEFDVVIVGAGPSGLSAAIRLIQKNPALNIAIIEKGIEVGAHILSGAAMDPSALEELIPDWRNQNPPSHTPITEDQFLLFTEKKSFRLPTPPQMKNDGNYIISLGQFCRWLAAYAEKLGVNIFPGFAATDVIYDNGKVTGIMTGDKGINKHGEKTARYQPGMALYAKQTFLAEGCRGSLSEKIMAQFNLRQHADPQTYGLGIKELWQIPESQHRAGLVMHSVGWPLKNDTYGGSFIYHFEKNLVALGFIIGLDYRNPYLKPYQELQRFKTHPTVSRLLHQGKRLAYGARSLNEGGWQSLPKLSFPGGLLLGCAAGMLNVPKIKGIHNAIRSGIIAADCVLPLLEKSGAVECEHYNSAIRTSKIGKELYAARNIRPAMTWGLWRGIAYAGLDTYILRGAAPWTFHNHADYLQLKPAAECEKILYPKPDNILTFDLMSSVFLTSLRQDEDQPCHLKLKDPEVAIKINFKIYASPETRYCPAGVYEIIEKNNMPAFQINAANCIHCKACDIKDPTQNIIWTPPEGGSGPEYRMM